MSAGKDLFAAHGYLGSAKHFKKVNKLQHDSCSECLIWLLRSEMAARNYKEALKDGDKALQTATTAQERSNAHFFRGMVFNRMSLGQGAKLPEAEDCWTSGAHGVRPAAIPCQFKELAAKFDPAKVAVVSVDEGDRVEKWVQFVEKDRTNWTQVLRRRPFHDGSFRCSQLSTLLSPRQGWCDSANLRRMEPWRVGRTDPGDRGCSKRIAPATCTSPFLAQRFWQFRTANGSGPSVIPLGDRSFATVRRMVAPTLVFSLMLLGQVAQSQSNSGSQVQADTSQMSLAERAAAARKARPTEKESQSGAPPHADAGPPLTQEQQGSMQGGQYVNEFFNFRIALDEWEPVSAEEIAYGRAMASRWRPDNVSRNRVLDVKNRTGRTLTLTLVPLHRHTSLQPDDLGPGTKQIVLDELALAKDLTNVKDYKEPVVWGDSAHKFAAFRVACNRGETLVVRSTQLTITNDFVLLFSVTGPSDEEVSDALRSLKAGLKWAGTKP